MGKITVFCSYAREDEAIRAQLEESIEPLRTELIIDDWYDNKIQAGARWNSEIGQALGSAKLILFLVTPDLLASSYISDVEIPKALKLEREGRCRVVPIIASQTDWGDSPLADFQALPKNATPIKSYSDQHQAYLEIREGLREVCKEIVDWENSFRRSKVGDWTYGEQTTTLKDGTTVRAEVVMELVKKTDTQAFLEARVLVDGQIKDQPLTIDLTTPLEDKMGDLMEQMGNKLPPSSEFRIGPKKYQEENLIVGGKKYETVKEFREISFSIDGWDQTGLASTWRCIDVPLDGIVKGLSEMPEFRQNLLLLDYGHAEDRARKPSLQGSPQSAATLFQPGRWQMQMQYMGMATAYDLMMHPNGALQGVQQMMGVSVNLQGQWGFNGMNNILTIQMAAMVMGMPTAQDLMQIQLQRQDGNNLYGADAMGRQFVLTRVG